VDDRAIRIIGSRNILQAAVAGKQIENGNVRGFVANGAPNAIRTGDLCLRRATATLAIAEHRLVLIGGHTIKLLPPLTITRKDCN
jgi:hypothetical protein